MLDLRRTVDEQGERARELAIRDAARVAREVDAALHDPATIERVPPDRRFRLDGGRASVAPPVALDGEMGFDPEVALDAVALERLRRATAATDAAAALAELAPLRHDPAVGQRGRRWLAARMAWTAHRAGDGACRDALLDDAGDEPSAVLLRAATGALAGEELASAFAAHAARATDEHAELLRNALEAHGSPAAPLRAALASVAARREVLRVATALAPVLTATSEPIVRVHGSPLVLFWPERSTGAVLPRDAVLELCRTLAPADASLGPAPGPAGATPAAAGLCAVAPAATEPAGLLSGPTGTALLVAALALVCGGGSFVAFRALRREAAALRLRTEFLTTVTHELKTPLAGIRLVAELLADDHVTGEPERRAWLGRLNAEAVRLGVLIENVLDLGRLERGDRPHAPERADVAALVADTAALFAPLAERGGFALRTELPGRALWADVDRDALRQALVNVLDNARKYGASPLDVAVRDGEETIEIAVRDHGAGIPDTERESIFDRFRRGAAHGHGAVPGVGLGLHLARTIAERHGGTLTCEAPAGGGAQFVFRLPSVDGGGTT
ncbi:MAG: HAMP domain-containing histidine kinase [Planctomycetes bacterium]|nr:HAMP domain-containing histidine kinase [Planctomycetota bacterium]